jgi:hypothetical protein
MRCVGNACALRLRSFPRKGDKSVAQRLAGDSIDLFTPHLAPLQTFQTGDAKQNVLEPFAERTGSNRVRK